MYTAKRFLRLLAAALVALTLFGCAEVTVPPTFTEATSAAGHAEEPAPHPSEETVPQTEEETAPQEEETPAARPSEEPAPDGTRPSEEDTAPGTGSDGHTHQWTESVVAPGCTTEGYAAHTCACGVTVVDGYIEATGHSFGSWVTVTEPTQDRTGEAERICAGCGEKERRTLDKLPAGHTHSYGETVTVEATCGAAGIRTFRCDCGDTYTDEIPRLDHSYTLETVGATCTQPGYDLHTCTACGHSYRDNYTERLPHQDVTVETPATCTEGSYVTFTCTVCGDTEIGHRDPSLGGHKWGKWQETKAPTEVSEGLKERSCTVCGEVETETVPPLTHVHGYTATVTEPTCTEKGYTTHTCSCGHSYTDSEVPARSHSYVHIRHKPTCTEVGYTHHECRKCGDSYIDTEVPATGHAWGEWETAVAPTDLTTGKAVRRCKYCGYCEGKILEKLPHTHSFGVTVEYVPSTCKAEGYAKKACACGETRTETLPKDHDWIHRHEDEVGHYDVRIMCHCGWSCSAESNYVALFAAHVGSLPVEERYEGHSYYDTAIWVVDVPARDWEECSACGTVK